MDEGNRHGSGHAASLRRHGRQPAQGLLQRRDRPRPAGACARRRHDRSRWAPSATFRCTTPTSRPKAFRQPVIAMGEAIRAADGVDRRDAGIQPFRPRRAQERDRLAVAAAEPAVRRQAGRRSRAPRRACSAGCGRSFICATSSSFSTPARFNKPEVIIPQVQTEGRRGRRTDRPGDPRLPRRPAQGLRRLRARLTPSAGMRPHSRAASRSERAS